MPFYFSYKNHSSYIWLYIYIYKDLLERKLNELRFGRFFIICPYSPAYFKRISAPPGCKEEKAMTSYVSPCILTKSSCSFFPPGLSSLLLFLFRGPSPPPSPTTSCCSACMREPALEFFGFLFFSLFLSFSAFSSLSPFPSSFS